MFDEQEVLGVVSPRDDMIFHNLCEFGNIIDDCTEIAGRNLGKGCIGGDQNCPGTWKRDINFVTTL